MTDRANEILDLALARRPTLAAGRLVAVDGPSGSGKTTLAATVAAAAAQQELVVRVLHLDTLYAGWSGLPGIGGTLDALLRPMASGHAGEAATWDWDADCPGPHLVLDPADLIVVEGVGAGHRRIADLVTVLAWCTAPPDAIGRALARDELLHPSAAADPSAYRRRLETWQSAEAAHFAVDGAEERADIVLG
jgi:energy-coupling factor transporter ATP-binding protein EcfA2